MAARSAVGGTPKSPSRRVAASAIRSRAPRQPQWRSAPRDPSSATIATGAQSAADTATHGSPAITRKPSASHGTSLGWTRARPCT